VLWTEGSAIVAWQPGHDPIHVDPLPFGGPIAAIAFARR
jgi:hypothetical protein